MHAEILLAVMVLAVALLVAVDFVRRSSEGPHEHIDRPLYDARRGSFTPSGAPVTAVEPAHAGRGGAAPPVRPAGAQGSWLVRTRLALLASSAAVAAAVATASLIRARDAVQGAPFHSDISSIRDGATATAILSAVVAVIALAVGGWASVILIRSVLRPLNQLRTGAVELAEVRLPDALRGGGRGPLAVRSVGVSSSDEIGEIARAFDQVQAEVLGVTSNEAGLRGKLGEMFVELSSRSQAMVERQIRLIDELEQGEQDAGRLSSLFKMDSIATRMRRYSQNLLILAGHELPGRWSQPVALIDVIKAAVSEIEEYERVSLSAEPGIAVTGPAVRDVVHLLAELTENATSLSAAGTSVDISGRPLASGGVLIDITDQGVGMNPDALAEANRRLDSPPAMDFAVSRNMGLFVVGRLATRHGIKVRLQPAAAGGLTAMVWLPDAVAARQDGGSPLDRHPAEREPATTSMWSAPVLEDAPVRSRQAPAAAYVRPGPGPGRHAWSDSAPQPAFHPHPPPPADPPAAAPVQPAAPVHRPPPPSPPPPPSRPPPPGRPRPAPQGHPASCLGTAPPHPGRPGRQRHARGQRGPSLGPGGRPAPGCRRRTPPPHLRRGRVGLVRQPPQAPQRRGVSRDPLDLTRRPRLGRRPGGRRARRGRRDHGRPAGPGAAGEPGTRHDQRRPGQHAGHPAPTPVGIRPPRPPHRLPARHQPRPRRLGPRPRQLGPLTRPRPAPAASAPAPPAPPDPPTHPPRSSRSSRSPHPPRRLRPRPRRRPGRCSSDPPKTHCQELKAALSHHAVS